MGGQCDLLYLPINFETGLCFGYCFINLTSNAAASAAVQYFSGHSLSNCSGDRVCEAAWSDPYQGFAAYVERYRNSPVMHPSVPDDHRPALFVSGVRRAFPAPTRQLKIPRARKSWRGAVN